MDTIKAQKSIEAVARLHGVPVEEVVGEIQAAIISAQKRTIHDPKAQEHWKNISDPETTPTAQSLIAYIVSTVEGSMEKTSRN